MMLPDLIVLGPCETPASQCFHMQQYYYNLTPVTLFIELVIMFI